MAKQKKNSSKKSNKEQLADGAKDIEKAKAEAAAEEKLELMPINRSINEILQDRVTVLEGNIGLKMSEDTTIEESLVILDYTTQMSDHVGFMIGDVLNFGRAKWGQKYSAALHQTGRALSTLKGYAEAAARIPAEKRIASLTFTHHRELIRLPDAALEKALQEVAELAEKGETPTTKEVRFKVQKLSPRKKKTPKRSTSGKRGKAEKEAKPEVVYKPTDEEQAKLDAAEEALQAAVDAIKAGKIYPIVAKLTNKEKKEWIKSAEPIVTFYNAVDRVTGY